MGHGRHVLTFPVGNLGPGQLLNLVAFVTDSNESWPSKDARSLTLSATRDDALRDFEQGGFGTTVQNLLRLIKDKMDKVRLFYDTAVNLFTPLKFKESDYLPSSSGASSTWQTTPYRPSTPAASSSSATPRTPARRTTAQGPGFAWRTWPFCRPS